MYRGLLVRHNEVAKYHQLPQLKTTLISRVVEEVQTKKLILLSESTLFIAQTS